MTDHVIRHADPSRSTLLILAGCRRHSRVSGQTDAASVAMPAKAAEIPANAAAHRLFRAAWSSHGLRRPIPSQVIGGAFVVADRNQKNAATNAQIADPICNHITKPMLPLLAVDLPVLTTPTTLTEPWSGWSAWTGWTLLLVARGCV
jgi:hypothetical protein